MKNFKIFILIILIMTLIFTIFIFNEVKEYNDNKENDTDHILDDGYTDLIRLYNFKKYIYHP